MIEKVFSQESLLSISTAVIGFVFGGFSASMAILLMFNVVDILTGIMVGGKGTGISSTRMTKGLKKKFGMWALVIVAHGIDVIAFNAMPVAKTGVLIILVSNEGISITENVEKLGVAVPKQMVQCLEHVKDSQLKDLEDNEVENKVDNEVTLNSGEDSTPKSTLESVEQAKG